MVKKVFVKNTAVCRPFPSFSGLSRGIKRLPEAGPADLPREAEAATGVDPIVNLIDIPKFTRAADTGLRAAKRPE